MDNELAGAPRSSALGRMNLHHLWLWLRLDGENQLVPPQIETAPVWAELRLHFDRVETRRAAADGGQQPVPPPKSRLRRRRMSFHLRRRTNIE
jgi:hypothetical protein